jgi:hypothetical protein
VIRIIPFHKNRNSSKAVSRIASLTNGTGTQLAFVTENSGTPAEHMRITSGGYIQATGASQVRLTLGSEGIQQTGYEVMAHL